MRNAFGTGLSIAIGLGAATFTLNANAQAFGNKRDAAFSAERLMGIYFLDEDDSGGTRTAIGLGFGAPGNSVYTVPRLGFDYFVIDSLSIGGALAFADFDPQRGNSTSGAMIAPRVGYAIEFSKVFGFWPRGGFTYRNFGGNEEFALTLEAMFYAAPVQHFAITFGPLMDLGIAGSFDEMKNFALLSAGLVGWI